MRTPPLLQRMFETQVGELLVRRTRIYEPKTGCRVAYDFPSEDAAIKAAQEMNEITDWFGVLKTRAEARRPNCQAELKDIAERHGGTFADGGRGLGVEYICAKVINRPH